MIQQIRKLLHAIPFVPFKIRTSDGKEYLVPTNDHALASPDKPGVVVSDDEGLYTILSGLHIVLVEAANVEA
jgi:hypothetical protein